jgi:hypothetical protein
MLENQNFFTFNNSIDTLHFTFSSVSNVLIFSVFLTAYLNFLGKSLLCQLFHLLGIDTVLGQPDPGHADPDLDPDPTKWGGSIITTLV